MAAGEGTRMRPISERWPKPILPIDGRPVVATLLRDLAAAGCDDVTVVTGHLAEQVEAAARRRLGLRRRGSVTSASRDADGSADAVRLRARRRRAGAGARRPAPTTSSARGTFETFVAEWGDAPGAVAARRGEPPLDARVARFFADPDGLTGVPLWGLGAELVPFLDDLPGPPFELADAFGARGRMFAASSCAGTRDLTHPVDLIRENFPYLSR